MKNQNFLSENFHFLVVKFSVYLNRHVFVMIQKSQEKMIIMSMNDSRISRPLTNSAPRSLKILFYLVDSCTDNFRR